MACGFLRSRASPFEQKRASEREERGDRREERQTDRQPEKEGTSHTAIDSVTVVLSGDDMPGQVKRLRWFVCSLALAARWRDALVGESLIREIGTEVEKWRGMGPLGSSQLGEVEHFADFIHGEFLSGGHLGKLVVCPKRKCDFLVRFNLGPVSCFDNGFQLVSRDI